MRPRVETATESDIVDPSLIDAAATVSVPSNAPNEPNSELVTNKSPGLSVQEDSAETVSESAQPTQLQELNVYTRSVRNHPPTIRFDTS